MVRSSFLARWDEIARGGRVAVVDAQGAVTFDELATRARRAAAHLLDGAPSLEGRRVAILVSPGAAWVSTFLGVLLAGGVAVPLSQLHPPAELAYFLADSGADTLVVSPDLASRVEGVAPSVARVSTHELAATRRAPVASSEVADDAAALMLYTSGTTGKPKGAEITHANMGVQAKLLREAWGFGPDDVLVHAIPLHHLHGLGISLMTALFAGGAAHMLEKFDAATVFEAFARATAFMGVPTMYQKLVEAFDAADDATRARWTANARRLRFSASGSAALPARLAERWRAISGDLPVERFGMTEIGVGISNPVSGERRTGSVGRALPTVELRFVDESGRDVDDGTPGEIWIRGPSVFARYHGRDDATKDAFRDGWFRSGDLAVRDADGFVRILGRTSVDILKSGGYKLSALEIEEVLREHPAVAEVAVVGLPDETWGDLVTAAIVAHPGHEREIDEQALRAWAKGQLAAYKVPRRFVRLDALPRNAVGKVVKPELARLLAAR